MEYNKNIKLDYYHMFFRNINFTQGFWLLYLRFKGFELFEIGMLETVFHVTSLSMEVPTGVIADVFGRKLSRVLGVLSYLLYILIIVISANFVWALVGFIFCGLSYTFESGSGDALVYDSLKEMKQEDRFMKINGNKEVIFQIASSISLFVGGYIAMVSFNLSFGLTAVFYGIALVIILLMKETPIKRDPNKKKISQLLYDQYVIGFKVVMKNKRLFYLIVIGAMMLAPVTSLFLYLPDHLIGLQYSKFEIGVLLGAHSLMAALGGYFAHKLEKKYKEKKILYFVPLFMTISFWLILNEKIIYMPFILLGFLESIFYVVLLDYMNKIIPSEIRATALSVSGLMFSLVMIVIFPIIGYLGDMYSLPVGFFVLAIIVTLFYVFLLWVLKKNHLQKV
ncbi:MAG: MFS transporter [Bacilli bacterium]|nr:MFS transporter [Bacilli bacterium]